jgi:hypothetical protein
MQAAESYVNERLDHLGIVAGVCQEIGLAAWLDEQDPTNRKPGERRNGNDRYDPEWIRFQQSSTLFGSSVFCQ